MWTDLPPAFSATRESLRALASYVIAPARWDRVGAIQLEPAGDAIATPAFDDGTRIVVHGDRLAFGSRGEIAITTLADCARLLDVALTDDLPHVGHDLPPFEPDRRLDIDPDASFAVAQWFAFGQTLLDDLRETVAPPDELSAAHLWPEHFDLSVVLTSPGDRGMNVGVSAGDSYSDEPYLYVGPWDMTGVTGTIWNAPFGATVTGRALETAIDPRAAASRFFADALAAAAAR